MAKGSSKNRQQTTKGQRRENIERKRDERSKRNAFRKEKNASEFSSFDKDGDDFKSFRNQLELQGLKMLDVTGDGNCLFRALADQLEGDESLHEKHRKETVNYMQDHEEDFAPFLDETVTFENYLENLASLGTFGGNDCIVAFARHNGVRIVIHQHNNPTFIIEGGHKGKAERIIHLAYHDFQHYSSVRRIIDPGGSSACNYHKDIEKRQDQHNIEPDDRPPVKVPKKRSKRQAKARLNERSDEFISKAVETVSENCDCQDYELIRKSLVENCYDVDSTITYIFQIMSLEDNAIFEQDNKEIIYDHSSCNHAHPALEDSDSDDMSLHDLRKKLSKGSDKSMDEIPLRDLRKKLSKGSGKSLDDIPLLDLRKKLSKESGKVESKSDVHSDLKCSCNEHKETHENCISKEKKVKVNETVHKKLSNRQRKELAKQARKKRRHESKKEDARADEVLNAEEVVNIKSISI